MQRSGLWLGRVVIALVVVAGGCTDGGSNPVVGGGETTVDGSEPDVDRGSDGGGGATCTDICEGCCLEGRCYPGTKDERCGSGGDQCGTCGENQGCFEGQCREPGCGNGALEPGEKCDGDSFRKTDCSALGFESGSLGCTEECRYDVSECSGSACEYQKRRKEDGRDFVCDFCVGDTRYSCAFCRRRETEDEVEDCSATEGERCYDQEDGVEAAAGAICGPEGAGRCESEDYEQKCLDDGSRTFCSGGLEFTTDCGDEDCHTRRVDGSDPGPNRLARCWDARSVPCEKSSFDPYCEGNAVVTCNEQWGRTEYTECIEQETCDDSYGHPVCFREGLGSCSWEDGEEVCRDERLYACHKEANQYYYDGVRCRPDE